MERLSKRLLERRDNAQPITILLAVALGIVFIFVLCLLLAVYVNRHDSGDSTSSKDSSCERLKKLDAVSPTRTLDQWWPTVKGSLGLSDAVDNQFVCVVCLEPVLRSQQIRELQCMHVFHKECLEKWYLGNHFNCPLCHRAYFHETRRPVHDYVWMV
ncbi:RING finger domain protein [Thermoascus aurantiacus ATCC 26904]